MTAHASTTVEVRDLCREHLEEVARIDALHTGESKPDYWQRVFEEFLSSTGEERVGVAAEIDGRTIGYLLGVVRAFEFGSEACGWVFAVGVDPDQARAGVASALLEHACERFRRAGVTRVRTMVQRNDVEVLSFFRANGFAGGSFVQLERDLEGRA
ncbi:MAG: GNAT family N-acetyltransferase [bacterium]|nr:GNAT family N-acetyltransferase [bacterium]